MKNSRKINKSKKSGVQQKVRKLNARRGANES